LSWRSKSSAQAANFAGLLAWRHDQPAPSRSVAPFPAARFFSGLRAVYSSSIAERSASALQSRGGDGFFCKCNRYAVARLPEHEVRCDCGGRRRPLELFFAARHQRPSGVLNKTTFQKARSRGDARKRRSPPRAAPEKPVPAIRAGRHSPEDPRGGTCRAGEGLSGRHILPRD
jgi:hypothetical protein